MTETTRHSVPPAAVRDFQRALSPDRVLSAAEDLIVFQYDGTIERGQPQVVVLPDSAEEVAAAVRIARRYDLPVVPRGAGTGLSGGAIPTKGGIMIAFARMNKVLEIDYENECAVVQPGVVNLDITRVVQERGYYYAPDPSSQRACTIGGNVAENAGGPHTLAYGVTTNHVLGIEAVLPDGTVIKVGGKEVDLPGYDLTGLLTGSEGTIVLEDDKIVRMDLRSSTGTGATAAAQAPPPENVASPVVSDASAHQRVIEDFIRAIRDGAIPATDGREARRSVELVETIYAAARKQRAIAPGDF